MTSLVTAWRPHTSTLATGEKKERLCFHKAKAVAKQKWQPKIEKTVTCFLRTTSQVSWFNWPHSLKQRHPNSMRSKNKTLRQLVPNPLLHPADKQLPLLHLKPKINPKIHSEVISSSWLLVLLFWFIPHFTQATGCDLKTSSFKRLLKPRSL